MNSFSEAVVAGLLEPITDARRSGGFRGVLLDPACIDWPLLLIDRLFTLFRKVKG